MSLKLDNSRIDYQPNPPVTPNISDTYFSHIAEPTSQAQNNGEPCFSLNKGFLRQYRDKKPNFGFNGLGEFVFYRTYSRVKSDGRKETFLDCVKRVVEGCYEIQRRHCRRIHIPWDYEKAQPSAQEMFDRMWNFKFLPPGRGLWMMGTKFMWERGSAALNNCFSGGTMYITREGIKTLKETVGSTQKILSTGGKWVDAKITSFGEQELLKLTLHRGRHTKTIYTTASHRWLIKSKSRAFAVANGVEDLDDVPKYKIRETTTDGLKPGTRLAVNFGSVISNNLRPSVVGIMHGICVGDGTTGSDNPNYGTYLYLCGDKDKQLLKYFSAFHVTDASERGTSGAKRVADLPRFFRQMPNLSEATTYLYGWLAGYFAADGRVSVSGSVQLSSRERSNLETVRSVCAILGIGTHEITSGLQTVVKDGITKKFLQHRITLFADHLRDDFFLIDEHLQRFREIRKSGRRNIHQYCYWVVDSVETTGKREQVYCAQVPDYHTFTLDGNILTGNCGFVSTDDRIESDPAEPFCFLMDMAMLGVGVGFDTKGAGKIRILRPLQRRLVYKIQDSREGWVDSVRALIWSYTKKADKGFLEFDYTPIRPAGTPIKGFGGKASGPGILCELHELIRKHLDEKIGRTLTSVDITDLMNYIGRCVVAGNVRRCLPKGTLVHLKRGLVPIEKVQVGDLVLTSDGYHPVTENVYQGTQRVLTIKTQMGQFRCTDRHRIAVLTDFGQYDWKRAKHLVPGDKMVFVDEIIPGTNTTLPGYSSSRGVQFVVPGLTDDVAWFIGYIHGDGYVYPGRAYKGRKHHGASVMAPVNRDEYHDDIERKVSDGFSAFGCFKVGDQPSQDNSHRMRVISRKLAHYFHKNFKQAQKPLVVPECILSGTVSTRVAYLAGLLDSDGSTKNRPSTLVSSVYNDFLRQVQTVYSSLGIPTKLKLRKEADENGQAKWELSLVGDFAISKFEKLIQPHAVKQLAVHGHASGNDFGYPSEWVTRDKIDYGKSWTTQSTQMTHNRALLCEAKVGNLVPVEVELVVDGGIECETYDLSVPDRSEFVAQGMLVHNTAEIAFGDAKDHNYCSMKNPYDSLTSDDGGVFDEVTFNLYKMEINIASSDDFRDESGELRIPEERLVPAIKKWNALQSHRWASNNSIFATVGMDYKKISKQIVANGEPGLMWLDTMRDFGRLIDGRQPGIDGRVKGGNPCLAGSMRLFTKQGYISLYDLWLAGGAQEYHGTDNAIDKYGSQEIVNANGVVPASRVYRTGKSRVYRVTFDDNSWVDATADHTMITLVRHASKKRGKTKYEEIRKNLIDLQIGDMVPLNRFVYFGTTHNPAYAELAGWCIGDGSLSPKKDGQVRAECTCYEDDAVTVLPRIQGLLHELYTTHNTSSNQKPAYAGWIRNQAHFEHHEERVGSAVLGRLLKFDGIRPGDKHNIPISIWSGTRETVAAFLRGLASADGFPLINESKRTISIRIKQSNAKLLRDCRLLLNQFGITSSVHKRNDASKQLMNDGKGGKKLYNRKAGYELIISGIQQVTRFLDYIGFIQESKMSVARDWLSNHFGSNNSQTGRYVKVSSIDYLGEEDTYCLTEPDDNRVVIEGYQIGQCLEQSLESYELCNLCETFPTNHDDADDYMRTLKFAYLYAKTVTLLPTHNPRTNQVTLRNRRIGLSQSGIVQAFAKFGRRTVLKDFCDAGYNEIRRWDDIYAEWLCVQRSVKVTSVKPSGTVSLVAGATPGIHFPEASTYWRRSRLAKDSVLVQILTDAGFHIEPDFKDPDRTVVVKFAVTDERVRAVENVSIWEQMANVVDYQRYWADNQVSVTIKFSPKETTEISRVLETFEDQLKGISFLPQTGHGYQQPPYEPCSASEVNAYNSRLKNADYTNYIVEAVGSQYCDSDKCEI